MKLVDIMENVVIQGIITLVVFGEDGEEKERYTFEEVNALGEYNVYKVGDTRLRLHISEYAYMEVAYIYAAGDGALTIELVDNEADE